MELAIKIVLLGACFFTSIYLITKLSDKLQKKENKKEETSIDTDLEESNKEK